MAIFLVLLASLSLVTSNGNPVGYQWEALEEDRNPEFQKAQNDEELQPMSFYGHYQENRKLSKDKYPEFQKDVLSSFQDDLDREYKTDARQSNQNENFGVRSVSSARNSMTGISSSVPNKGPQIQTSNFHQRQDISEYGPTPQIQTELPNQEDHRRVKEDVLGKVSRRGQKYPQKDDSTFSVGRSSDVRGGVYRSSRLPNSHHQIPLQGSAFRNQNQDQQSQQDFPQNEARKVHDDSQYFSQTPYSTKEENDVPSFQEQVNQSQTLSQQNRKQFPSSGNLFSPGQTAYGSRSGSFPATGPMMSQHGDYSGHAPITQFQNREVQDRPVNRGNVQVSSGVPFRDGAYDRIQPPVGEDFNGNVRSGAQVDYQKLFQNIREHQPILTVPQMKHQIQTTSVAISGAKTPVRPFMVYKTGGIASPHAIVLDKDSNVHLGKASVTQHVQTPYVQYTYNHPL